MSIRALVPILCVLLPTSSVFAQGGARTGETGPKAVVAEPVIDVGIVARGEKITRAFEIRNEGVTALAIQEVRPGCGCTVAKYDETVAPGATGKVVVDLDTTAFSGPIAKSVSVYTDDPAAARITLTVKADIQPFVAVDPGYARHFHVRGAALPEPQRQLVWATDGRALEISRATSPVDGIAVTTRRASASERNPDGPEVQWVVETSIKADAPIGPIAGRVELVTNHPKQRLVTVSVSGSISPQVSVSPPRGSLGVVDPSATAQASVLITNNSEGDLELAIESVTVEGLQAVLRTVDAKRTQLALTLPAGHTSGPLQGSVVIKTNLADPARIEIPIDGAVR